MTQLNTKTWFKVIVAGSRDFDDYELLKIKLDKILSSLIDLYEIEIVSGMARGADRLGERYAAERGYRVKDFKADWDRYGKPAGPIRNEEMAQYADACVVFWKNKSKGSRSMIDLAKKYKLKLRVIDA
jgi:hypothetical protein